MISSFLIVLDFMCLSASVSDAGVVNSLFVMVVSLAAFESDKSSGGGFAILIVSQSTLLSNFLPSLKTGLGRFDGLDPECIFVSFFLEVI